MIDKNSISGIVLAGGKSSRMGCNKAFLELGGKSLLHRQVEKLRMIGIDNIIISGPEQFRIPGLPVVPDKYEDCGPIGGIHACLDAAMYPNCLVLSVDLPLISVGQLEKLCRFHDGDATFLSHNGQMEPLVAVYNRNMAAVLEEMIRRNDLAVRNISKYVSVSRFEYTGAEELLCNCNTIEDFARVLELYGNRRN